MAAVRAGQVAQSLGDVRERVGRAPLARCGENLRQQGPDGLALPASERRQELAGEVGAVQPQGPLQRGAHVRGQGGQVKPQQSALQLGLEEAGAVQRQKLPEDAQAVVPIIGRRQPEQINSLRQLVIDVVVDAVRPELRLFVNARVYEFLNFG